MILEVAPLQIIPGQAAAFEQAFEQAQRIISTLPGYAGHQLQRSLTDPHRYLLLVNWQRLEDHTLGFRGSPSTSSGRRCSITSTIPSPLWSTFRPYNLDQPRMNLADQG